MKPEDYKCQVCGETAAYITADSIPLGSWDSQTPTGYTIGPVTGAWCKECYAKREKR